MAVQRTLFEVVNILVIAGYDVLADKILNHQNYVEACLKRAIKEEVDLIFTVGGFTNPDYPALSEAAANENIIDELENETEKPPVISIPYGNTSTESLERLKEYIEKFNLLVNKIVFCAEQSRLAGFLLDAFMVGLIDSSGEIVAYGYSFPESHKSLSSQKKKILLKILSHHNKFFRFLRGVYQKIHQQGVARQKRKNKN